MAGLKVGIAAPAAKNSATLQGIVIVAAVNRQQGLAERLADGGEDGAASVTFMANSVTLLADGDGWRCLMAGRATWLAVPQATDGAT